MDEHSGDDEPVEPISADGVLAVTFGIVAWLVALIVLAIAGAPAETLWICAVGAALGLAALPYLVRRRAVYRRPRDEGPDQL